MIAPKFRISEIRSLKLRACFLIAVAAPALTDDPFLFFDNPLERLIMWAIYALGIQLLIFADAKFASWLAMFSVACLISVLTGLSGAVFDSCRNGLHNLFDPNAVKGLAYLQQIILMLAVIPLALFTARSLPPSEILERAMSKNETVTNQKALLILIMRILNHTTEVVVGLLPGWREEMPELIRPRIIESGKSFPKEIYERVIRRVYFIIYSVCLTFLVHSLQPLPLFIAEIDRLTKNRPTH